MDLLPRLYLEAIHGNLKAARAILLEGDNVNVKVGKGHTPLHAAAFKGKREMCFLLLEHGADPTALDTIMRMPPDLARFGGHSGLADVLYEQARRYCGAKIVSSLYDVIALKRERERQRVDAFLRALSLP